MLIQVSKIDTTGFYIEPVVVINYDVLESDLIAEPIPEGFYKPKWTGTEWVEGLSQPEIDAIKNAKPPMSELEQLKKQQELMQKAIDDIILGGTI